MALSREEVRRISDQARLGLILTEESLAPLGVLS